MDIPAPQFTTRLATGPEDVQAAQRLRYDVFVRELGGQGSGVDHEAGLERDPFDAHADHLLLLDETRQADPVVGVYRVLRKDQARAAGRYYCDSEYDLTPLIESGRPLLELGRSCVHKAYRGGAGLFLLWNALADYVAAHGIEILFGVASFHGTEPERQAHALTQLRSAHLAPPELRVRSRAYQPMDLLPEHALDRKKAVLEMPALIKAYLRLGGFVGDGAFVDQAFNTTDICMILDTERMNARQRALYQGGRT